MTKIEENKVKDEKKSNTKIEKESDSFSKDAPKFKGRYISTIGRRKRSVARVRLYKNGNGAIIVNEQKVNDYFSTHCLTVVRQPLKLTSHLRDFDFSILVSGGGKNGQSEAIRHGISRALIEFDEKLRLTIKAKGWLTRDARRKERKKPGLKKARRAPQWSKR